MFKRIDWNFNKSSNVHRIGDAVKGAEIRFEGGYWVPYILKNGNKYPANVYGSEIEEMKESSEWMLNEMEKPTNKTQPDSPEPETPEYWKEILWAAIQCEKKFKEFVKSVEHLTGLTGHSTLWFLGKILPKTSSERKRVKVVEFVQEEKFWIDKQKEEAKKEEERERLLKELSLTPEQKKILGIK